jgi:hypothetical protein
MRQTSGNSGWLRIFSSMYCWVVFTSAHVHTASGQTHSDTDTASTARPAAGGLRTFGPHPAEPPPLPSPASHSQCRSGPRVVDREGTHAAAPRANTPRTPWQNRSSLVPSLGSS